MPANAAIQLLLFLPWTLGPRFRGDERRRISDQSTEILANSTTLRHFSVSLSISLPNSSGVPGAGTAPSSVNLATILGSASAAFTALFRIATISGGVPFGAEM